MIRKITEEDILALQNVLESIELFPPEILPEMISDFFENPDTEHLWYTYLQNEVPIALMYCAPEMLTDGTCNLYAIGVAKAHQAKGIGKALLAYLEEVLRQKGKRILIIETSGADEMEPVRKLYEACGYQLEATLHDFWQEGEDKVVYQKYLLR